MGNWQRCSEEVAIGGWQVARQASAGRQQLERVTSSRESVGSESVRRSDDGDAVRGGPGSQREASVRWQVAEGDELVRGQLSVLGSLAAVNR